MAETWARRIVTVAATVVATALLLGCESRPAAPAEAARPRSTDAAAAPAPDTSAPPLRTARVQAFDRANGIYILDVGSTDGIAPGDRYVVKPGAGERAMGVIIDKVFAHHSAARPDPDDDSGLLPRSLGPRIDGRVSAVDDDGTRFVLSVGSDDGVTIGMELTLHRDGAYVATVEVVRVSAHACETQVKGGQRRSPPRVGDEASKVL